MDSENSKLDKEKLAENISKSLVEEDKTFTKGEILRIKGSDFKIQALGKKQMTLRYLPPFNEDEKKSGD